MWEDANRVHLKTLQRLALVTVLVYGGTIQPKAIITSIVAILQSKYVEGAGTWIWVPVFRQVFRNISDGLIIHMGNSGELSDIFQRRL